LKAERLDLLLTPKKFNDFEPPLVYNLNDINDTVEGDWSDEDVRRGLRRWVESKAE
jgi:hypothetical protein